MSTRDFPTLAERKAARVAALHEAVADLRDRLRDCARSHGGRFLLYGSATRGELRFDSDIDLLIDFPEERLSAAWRFAEEVGRELNVKVDLCPLAWCRDDFLTHIGKHAVTLE